MYNMQEIRAIETLDEATTIIRNEMESVFDGFIDIGYYLKKVRDDQLYKQNGYESIFDYGQKVFNLSRYSTTRFMEVNDQYSIGGYSPEIDERWKGYGSSKLIEMLAIPGEIREEIPPEVTVKEIREAKTIIRETEEKFDPQMSLCDVAQEEEPEEWMKDLVKHLFREDKKAFEQMVEFERSDIGNDRAGIEEDVLFMTNPSKFKMIRLEKANVMMLEKVIRVMPYRVGGELKEPEEFSYIDLAMAFEEVFFQDFPDISGSMQSIYERVYGVPLYETVEKKEEKPEKTEEKKREKPKVKPQEKRKKLPEKPQEKKEKEKPDEKQKEEQIPGQTEEIAQKSAEILEREVSDEVENGENNGALEGEASEPETEASAGEGTEETELCSTESGTEAMNAPDIIDKPFGTRKDYMDTLTAYGMAIYMAEEYERHTLKASFLAFPSELEKWLLREVDENGREIEEVEE